jgi:prevent-host-death family protein
MRNKRRTDSGKKAPEELGITHISAHAPWTVADAKPRLSEVLEKAQAEGPQIITRNGERAAVVVSIEEWERKTKRTRTLADFLLASPLRGSDIDLERLKGEARDIDL